MNLTLLYLYFNFKVARYLTTKAVRRSSAKLCMVASTLCAEAFVQVRVSLDRRLRHTTKTCGQVTESLLFGVKLGDIFISRYFHPRTLIHAVG